MARALATLPNRVQRPSLTLVQEALQSQYRPAHACAYCVEVLKTTTWEGQWLMEVPSDGGPLEFYCSGCGHYKSVVRAI